MRKVNVAVIGYGHLGRWHAQKADAHANANLVAIVEPNIENAQKAQVAHPEVKMACTIEEIVDEIDAAVIVTPTSTHFELMKFLLNKKKHVFCEKPLCSTEAQAKVLGEYVSNDLVLQVGHSERYHLAWKILEEEIKKIKSPFTLKIKRVAPFKGRATDVDVVQDLMIHDLDLLDFLMGEEVLSVSSIGHKIRTSKWDQVDTILDLSGGSKAMITSGRNHVHEERSLEIIHNEGLLYVDMFHNIIKLATNATYEGGEFVKEFSYDKRDHLALEHDAFYSSILDQSPVLVGYDEGLKAVRMIERVLKSLEESAR